MKTVLVLYDQVSADRYQGFGFLNRQLAKRLQEAGALERLVCSRWDPRITDIPRDKIISLIDHKVYWNLFKAIGRLGRNMPGFNARRFQESLFDRFLCEHLPTVSERLVFFTRPLFPAAVQKMKQAGLRTWALSSVPHPLLSYALVRNEELRLGLPAQGAYTDHRRAERLTQVITSVDRLLTLAPEIGRFTYESYLTFIQRDRVQPLTKYFNVDLKDYEPDTAERKPPASKSLTFLHVSFINLIKGLPYLLDAWRRFQSLGYGNCRLILVGRIDRNVSELIQRRYSDLAGVEYRGFVPDLKLEYAAADVFVSPSISDAGPATIVEAMAAGLPVISSRNCGLASLIREAENGYTYTYNDVPALTDLLVRCADDPQGTAACGRRARATVENHSIDEFAEELLELIRRDG